MSDTTTVSPLRQRMIEDTARELNPHTQRSHISSCKRFAVWLKRSPLFDELHSGRRDRDVILFGFDLLELDGADLRPLPLIDRKAMLGKLPAPVASGIELSEHIEADGATVFRHACKLGCEGIVSKHRTSPYRSGRARTWIKVKNSDSPATTRVWER